MAHVDISCLCGKLRSTVLLAEPIPVQTILCHRSQCRWNLGALCHSALDLSSKDRPAGIELLKAYEVPDTVVVRFFCETCGSHIYENDLGWKVQAGVVENIHSEQVLDALEEIVGHSYVHDTKDGGLSKCLSGLRDEHSPKLLRQPSESRPQHDSPGASTSIDQGDVPDNANESDKLKASCACGGTRFFVTRPNPVSAQVSSPWPDLIVPYHEQSPENTTDEKWWIRERRWLAGTCACRSCRLALGSPIQAWAFVAKSNLFNRDGSPLSYSSGSLKSFESSPGAIREFCNTCGATIFWHNQERPGVVDVSVGVFRASDGALAKSWLSWWTERVSFAEDAYDRHLIGQLAMGLHKLR